MSILLKHGVDPNPRSEEGATPRMQVCIFGRTDVVKFLPAHKADLAAYDQFGLTALKVVIMNKHAGIVKLLGTHGSPE